MNEVNSKQELEDLINGELPILLDFYADWCGSCKAISPIVDSLSEKHADDFVIAKINVDKNQEIAREFQVKSIPALLFIKDKNVQEKLVGVQSKESLEGKIERYSKASA